MKAIDKAICGVLGSLYGHIYSGVFPPVVRIETTNRCNARCTICPHPYMTRPIGVMEEGLYRSIIDECAHNGCRKVHLHNFGEPLLDPDLPHRIAYAKAKGIGRVKFFTNGSLLSGDIALGLLESGIDEIKVSIDGADKQEFESIRVGLNYDKVMKNIRNFVNLRDQEKMTTPKVIFTCCSTSDREKSEDNLKGIVDSYEFVKIHNWGDQDIPKRWPIRKPCWRLWGTFTILWNGDVVPCCLDFDGKVVLGNLKTDGSIATIWKNKRYEHIRRLHRTASQAKISICKDCSKSFV